MQEMSPMQASQARESEYRRLQNDLRTMKKEYQTKYEKGIKVGDELLKGIDRDYESKITTLRNETERKINEMRIKHMERLKIEERKLDSELMDLKQIHEDKKKELQESQSSQINQMNDSHQRTLEQARTKFEASMSKYGESP